MASPLPGDQSSRGPALDENAQASAMLPLVYDELRRLAAGMLRADARWTIQPTALVQEAYIRLSGETRSHWTSESHFRAVASIAMRRVLADHAKSRRRLKRGGGRHAVMLSAELAEPAQPTEPDLADVDEALTELEATSPRVARLLIYRFLGDLSVAQAAERLGISLSTAEADWRFGRAWLKRRLSEGAP